MIALIGVGAAVFFLTKKKSGSSKQTISAEPDYEDEPEIVESEDDDDINFYDNDNDDE